MCLLLFLPAADASCPHHPQCLLQMEGGEEPQRKGVGEADWRGWQQRRGSAGPWRSPQEPHLTQKQQQNISKTMGPIFSLSI